MDSTIIASVTALSEHIYAIKDVFFPVVGNPATLKTVIMIMAIWARIIGKTSVHHVVSDSSLKNV